MPGPALFFCDSASSDSSSSASTGSSEGLSGRAGFESTDTAGAENDSDKGDAEEDADCGFNFGVAGVASISSTAECIFVVVAGVAVKAAVGATLGAAVGT